MHRMANKIIKIVPVLLFYCCGFFAACHTSSKTSMQQIITTQRAIMPADSLVKKLKKGIDFIASGNDPAAWSLEIDFDKMVYFNAADGNTFNILSSFSKKENTAEAETYIAQTDLGQVTIRIFNSPCNNTGNTTIFTKKTEVLLKNKRYTGCGKYLFDQQLNDIWVLEKINNEQQSAAAFQKGLPSLEFNLLSGRMTGSDGCNAISSTIEIKGNRIGFSAFSGTKMACNNNQAQNIFAEKLSNKHVNYYMENNRLVLYLEDDSKISFKRKDL